jgi:hypothetical protein
LPVLLLNDVFLGASSFCGLKHFNGGETWLFVRHGSE